MNNVSLDTGLITNACRAVKKRFFTTSCSSLGIDINSHSVRVVELDLNNVDSTYQVNGFGYATISQSATAVNCIEDADRVADAVAEAISLSGSKLQHVATAVSGSSVISKVVDVPCGLTDDELEIFLSLNSDKYIPFPLNEVAIDFQKLNIPSATKDREKILLTACRRDVIDKLVAAINTANLSVQVIDVAPFATERALENFPRNPNPENGDLGLIVEIGENYIVCNLIDNEGALFVREEAINSSLKGVNKLSQDEFSRASPSYRSSSIQSRAEIKKDPCGISLKTLTAELKRALQMASSSTNYEIGNLVLIGEAVPSINELDAIQESLERKVSLGNPFQSMRFGPHLDPAELALRSSVLVTACGLALRGLS